MKDQFTQQTFASKSVALIETAETIINEYLAQGLTLSLRQLFYQFVSRVIIENSEKSYKNLGGLIAGARMAGLLDWDAIEDRGREVLAVSHWRDPAHITDESADVFHIDKWEDQSEYVIVMVEKQALEGVLMPVCRELDVPFCANKGYSSASALYELGKTLYRERRRNGKGIHVIYLGDHDPSGIDMTRDVEERLALFSRGDVEVHRLALNMDQVEQYNPPENPTKVFDSRATGYIARFGSSSWELDALNPMLLADLLREQVTSLRDEDLWRDAVEREREMVEELRRMAGSYRTERDTS